jgi:threonylcarbamoyladenosine tRNA methylthiotransferase MtaB
MAEIVTFGCRLNTVESEAIRAHAGHLADTIVVNTCAVTLQAERDARQAIARLHRERPDAPIVVTGCAVQIDPSRWAALPGVSRVLGNQEKLQAAQWRTDASAVGPIAEARHHTPAPLAGMEGRARAFLDVQQGCDHACTFCIIPQGRGPNRSVAIEAVADQIRRLVLAGGQEVVLTGVDLASWGRDLADRPGLGVLVREVLRLAPDLPRLRLSSLDPAALDDAFWDVLADEPRLMPHLHLSIQAGSDMVLKRMRRRHSRGSALAAIDRARRLRPGLAIGADLIAGFPTETDAQFDETLAFIDDAALPYVHVFPYSARPGTPAARMPQLAAPLRRARAARLRDAAAPHAARLHAALVGAEAGIVVERGGRGHTEGFAPVRLGAPAEVGRLIRRRIIAADAAGVEAA